MSRHWRELGVGGGETCHGHFQVISVPTKSKGMGVAGIPRRPGG